MDQEESAVQVGEALSNNYLFETLAPEEIRSLTERLEIMSFEPGENIVREGDAASSLFLVLSGNVNVLKGSGQFLANLGPRGFFGEMGLFVEGSRRTASCVASHQTSCAQLHREELHAFCESQPAIGVKIYKAIVIALSQRLQATSADLAMLMNTQVGKQTDVADVVERAKQKRIRTRDG